MPDITDAQYRQFLAYQDLGTPEDVRKKVKDLETDNQEYRQTKIPALEAKVPKENQAIVEKADVVFIEELKPLGKPADIKAKLESGNKAAEELVETKQRLSAATFAKAARLADETVDTLIAIPQLKGATFEVRKGKIKDAKGNEVDGEIPYIKLAGENQSAMKFEEAKEKIPALKGLRTADPSKPADRAGVSFVPQGGETGGEGGGGSLYDNIRNEVKARQEPKKDADTAVKPLTERLGMARTV